uniref:Uncharacterized protein n=1 Tax=Trichogramma kaykai TaxID=54128 RepID=A0ABD2WK82_9HYME
MSSGPKLRLAKKCYLWHLLKYILDPVQFTDDSYYLLSNGSIFAPNYVPFMFEPGVDYCIEEIPGIGISVIICISPEVASPDICESKKADDVIEILKNDEIAKLYEEEEPKEIKHLICGKINKDSNAEEGNLSDLQKSHNTILWQRYKIKVN